MPMLTEVRRLGAGWEPLCRRIATFMQEVGPEGIPRVDFERECLGHIDMSYWPGIVRALKGKGLIFPVRDGVAWRVFRERPANRRFETVDESDLDQFLRVLAPHMRRLTLTVRARPDDRDPESRRREVEAARQIAMIVRRHVGKGLDLDKIRAGIADTFTAESVAALTNWERVLQRGSERMIAAVPEPRKRIPNGLPPHERLVALIEKAGRKGITKTDLVNSFQPRRPAAEIAALLKEIEEDVGLIQSLKVKLSRKGRPAQRYWHSSFETPDVINGIAVFD